MRHTVADLIAEGTDRDEAVALLGRMELRPVFTAHPTEAKRRSVLAKRHRIAELLEQRRDPRRDAYEVRRLERRLREVVELLWLTDELRHEKPTPREEAASNLFFMSSLALDVLPVIADDLAALTDEQGLDLPECLMPLRFGTWVGGDRDGNPFVTAEVTLGVPVPAGRACGRRADHSARSTGRRTERLEPADRHPYSASRATPPERRSRR